MVLIVAITLWGLFLIISTNSALGAALVALALWLLTQLERLMLIEKIKTTEYRINKTLKGVWKFIEERLKNVKS